MPGATGHYPNRGRGKQAAFNKERMEVYSTIQVPHALLAGQAGK